MQDVQAEDGLQVDPGQVGGCRPGGQRQQPGDDRDGEDTVPEERKIDQRVDEPALSGHEPDQQSGTAGPDHRLEFYTPNDPGSADALRTLIPQTAESPGSGSTGSAEVSPEATSS